MHTVYCIDSVCGGERGWEEEEEEEELVMGKKDGEERI